MLLIDKVKVLHHGKDEGVNDCRFLYDIIINTEISTKKTLEVVQ